MDQYIDKIQYESKKLIIRVDNYSWNKVMEYKLFEVINHYNSPFFFKDTLFCKNLEIILFLWNFFFFNFTDLT